MRDQELYGPHSELYRSITEAFQRLGGMPKRFIGVVRNELPSLLGLLSDDQKGALKDRLNRLHDNIAGLLGGLASEAIVSTVAEVTSKFTGMLDESKATALREVEELITLLKADPALTRISAAVSLGWYMDSRACEPLLEATRDSDRGVQMAACWALRALENALRYRR